jgi:hypothetical protein
MITLYDFYVLHNYVQCFARAGNPLEPQEKPELQAIYFIPKLRSRIIVNLESGKRSNVPCSITILADASFLMSVERYNLLDDGSGEEPINQPVGPPTMRVDILFTWDGTEIDFNDLINNLAEHTALITNL